MRARLIGTRKDIEIRARQHRKRRGAPNVPKFGLQTKKNKDQVTVNEKGIVSVHMGSRERKMSARDGEALTAVIGEGMAWLPKTFLGKSLSGVRSSSILLLLVDSSSFLIYTCVALPEAGTVSRRVSRDDDDKRDGVSRDDDDNRDGVSRDDDDNRDGVSRDDDDERLFGVVAEAFPLLSIPPFSTV
jgi:hypothetical protein